MDVTPGIFLIQEEEIATVPVASDLSWDVIRRMAAVINYALDNVGAVPVGQYEISSLTEAQFQAQKGSNWILADGRNVAGSLFATTFGVTNVSDWRGCFFRGKDNGRGQDTEWPLDTLVTSDYASHTHSRNLSYVGTGIGTNLTYDQAYDIPGEKNKAYTYNDLGMPPPQYVGVDNGFQVQNAGGAETRPKNITVNVFVKIN